ncbi:MAG: hypothetical protein SGPRY_007233 [Prymnesium sp.]
MRLQLSPSQIVTAVLTLSALRSRGRAHHPQLSPTPSDQQRTRVAIDQLYARLPEAFSKAGLLGRSVELWGVTLSTAHSPSAAERALLRSFLRVREWDVDDTVYMLGEALSLFVLVQVCMLEQLMRLLDFTCGEPRYTMVLDCREMHAWHISRSARICAKVRIDPHALSSVMCDNYPDCIERVMLVSPPKIISIVLNVLGPFLPQSFSDNLQAGMRFRIMRKICLLCFLSPDPTLRFVMKLKQRA